MDIKWKVHKRTRQEVSAKLESYIYTKYTWSMLLSHVCLISYSRPPCCIHVPWHHLPDPSCYKLKTLELVKRMNLVLGLTQENSIENSIQNCLPYIQIPNGLYKLFLAYPKWPCICFKVNICITHCMTSSFYASCNLWPYHLMWPAMWQHDLVTLTLTLVLKIE